MRRYCLILCCAFACEAPEPADDEVEMRWDSLLDAEAWTSVPARADPLAAHRPQPVICGIAPWRPEGGGIEVDTQGCNYVSVRQPLLVHVARGDLLRLTAWWDRLASESPAAGHIAVLIGDEIVWEEHVAIPGEADIRDLEFESPVDAEPGTPVVFHLHNHGYNTWRLQSLQVATEDQ